MGPEIELPEDVYKSRPPLHRTNAKKLYLLARIVSALGTALEKSDTHNIALCIAVKDQNRVVRIKE